MIPPIEELEDGEGFWRCPECGLIVKLSYDMPAGVSYHFFSMCMNCGAEMELQD